MKLNVEEIKNITQGVEYFTEEDGCVIFHRFNKAEENFYKNNPKFDRVKSSSGVILHFTTNSDFIFLEGKEILASSTRKFYSIDVEQDGKIIKSIKNCKGKPRYDKKADVFVDYPTGKFSEMVKLKKGEKEIRILLPFAMQTVFTGIEIADYATIEPVKRKKKIIFYGDSITQGYDSVHPSDHYTAKVADKLDAEFINKGFGGEVFNGNLVHKSKYNPDYVFVAYGTNDFERVKRDEFVKQCHLFFAKLCDAYPDKTIFALSPIWRKGCGMDNDMGFFKIKYELLKVAGEHDNVKVIDGFSFVPKRVKYFADFKLHPNDKGFKFYTKSLIKALKKHGFYRKFYRDLR